MIAGIARIRRYPIKAIGGEDIARAIPLKANAGRAFQGVTPRGELRRKKAEELGALSNGITFLIGSDW